MPLNIEGYEIRNRDVRLYEQTSIVRSDNLSLHLDASIFNTVSYGSTWFDLSGRGNNGTFTNGPVFNASNGGSIGFDGTDDEVLINNTFWNNMSGTYNYTILVWIYPSLGGVTWHGIISKGNSQQYALTINSPNRYLHYETNQGGVGALNSANNTVDLNTWQQVGIRFDGTNKTIWKNGSIIATQAASNLNSASNTEQLRIGEGNNGEQYRGNIGSVLMYSYQALSDAEIAHNYNVTKGRFGL